MNANEVLTDILEDNSRWQMRVLEIVDEPCMRYKPHPEANDIGVTIWAKSTL